MSSFSSPAPPAPPPAVGPLAVCPTAVCPTAGAALYEWDLVSDRLSWGVGAAAALGADLCALQSGRALAERLHPDSRRPTAAVLRAGPHGAAQTAYSAQYGLMRRDGGVVWVEETGRWFAGPTGAAARARGLIRPLAADAPALAPGGHCAAEAPRAAFFAMLDRRARAGRPLCLALLTPVDPQAIPDDGPLVALARSVRAHLRSNDHLTRLREDTLAVALDGCDASRLKRALARFVTGANVRARIGAAQAGDRLGAAALLARADHALERARASGRPFHLFDAAAEDAEARRRAAAAQETLLAALNGGNVALMLSPVVGAQGRARFCRAELGVMGPDGRMRALGVVDPALAPLADSRLLDAAAAEAQRRPSMPLALDLAIETWRDATFLARLEATLRHTPARRLMVGVPHARLDAATWAAVARARGRGASAMLTGFGAGAPLDGFVDAIKTGAAGAPPFDVVMIEGAFTADLARSSDARFAYRALIAAARPYGRAVGADWADTRDVGDLVRGWGVDLTAGAGARPARTTAPGARAPRAAACAPGAALTGPYAAAPQAAARIDAPLSPAARVGARKTSA